MKVCLISNLYEPYARGGAEVIVKRTAQELTSQGHRVTIITACPWAGLASLKPSLEEKDGLRIYRYYPLNIFFYGNDSKHSLFIRFVWHLLDIFNVSSARRIRRTLKIEQPSLVITHNLMGLGFAIPSVIRSLKIPHMHVLHDIQLAVRSGIMTRGAEHGWQIDSLAARLYQSITRSLFGSPDIVVSPSKFLLDFYKKLGFFTKSFQQVLSNPVDSRFLDVKHHGDDTVRFLYIGQFAEHKGILELGQAFMQTDAPQARLTLIGDGPLLNEVYPIENNDARVQTMPRISNEDLPAVLAETDVLVLPTKTYENSPTVVFEALAAGVPVLVSDIGGSAEWVQHQQTGFVMPQGGIEDIKAGLRYFLDLTPTERQAMGEQGRKNIASLTSEAYVKRLLERVQARAGYY